MNRIPRIAQWILSITSRKHSRENVLGDFAEFYEVIRKESGQIPAYLWYWKQAIISVPEFIRSAIYFEGVMIKNYLKISFRNMMNQKLFSTINILGLALGLAVCMLSIIFVQYELSYDTYHKNADNIFRVTIKYDTPSGYNPHFARCPETYVNNLPDEFPEVETLIRFQMTPSVNLKIGEEKVRSTKWYFTDHNVFEVFSFPFLYGDASTALLEPKSVVLSEQMSQQYFGLSNPVGQEIGLRNEVTGEFTQYKITGVMKKIPANSHFQIDYLSSYPDKEARQGWAWIYILVKPGSDALQLQNKFPEFIKKYDGEEAAQYSSLHLQALTDIHLYSNLDREIEPNGDIQQVHLFIGIALGIILIAAFNFMNLSTARSVKRAKEVGVRKVLGAARSHLVNFYIWESILFSLIAFMVALLLIIISFPYFNSLLGNLLTVSNILNIPLLVLFFVITLLTGIFAGVYPALVLSSFSPHNAFIQNAAQSGSGKRFSYIMRRSLVVLQFSLSIVLIIITLFSYHQYSFISNKKLGFNKEQTLAISNVSRSDQVKYPVFKNKLENYTGISGVTACMDVPSKDILDQGFTRIEGMHSGDESTILALQSVDNNYIGVMDIDLICGKSLDAEAESYMPDEVMTLQEMQNYVSEKEHAFLLNESAVKKLGFKSPEESIGRKLQWSNSAFSIKGRITGVVKDFHYASLHLEIRPMILVNEPLWLSNFLVKVSTANISSTVKEITKIWNDVYPESPLQYDFLDDLFANLYRSEERQGQLFSLFSVLAIFIAYLGLFGLVAYTTEQRTKEIGIRKIVGASIPGMVTLLAKEFLKWILIANIIAIPIAYFFVREWLSEFAYKIEMDWKIFALASVVSIFVAATTVSYQTIKASLSNPVDALKYE